MKLLILFGLVLILAVIMATTNQGVTPSAPPPTKKEEMTWMRATIAAARLQDAMRDPDSFKITSALFMPNDAICYQYRSRNGFGGMNVGHAVLAPSGEIKTSEMSGFQALWKKHCRGKTGTDNTDAVDYAITHRRR